ncbi:MAG: nitrate/sulfonate/bicarbonate ABC transporter ATP-binding protein [Gammaproteobacteria bacterium]
MDPKAPILEIKHVSKGFKIKGDDYSSVLEDINFSIKEREIVGILGRSGSGKSTILRMIAGLIQPSSGEVLYRGDRVTQPYDGLSMVFQSCAVFPWLTVLENVAIGLTIQNLPKEDVTKRSLEAISLIGLDGYESAYPRELSGGMRQRVGFARALVVNPELMIMDEPFSALDVLTADTLKSEFIDLWMLEKVKLKSIIIVTHNIEEAVLLCDRVIILSSNPGKIVTDFEIELKYPRNKFDPAFRELVDDIYTIMTTTRIVEQSVKTKWGQVSLLPFVSVNKINGIVEMIHTAPFNGNADLPRLSESLQITAEELFPILEGIQLFKFAIVEGGDVHLTAAGRMYADADILMRKKIFGKHLIENVPLAAYIRRTLQESPEKQVDMMVFLKELENNFETAKATDIIEIIISWGRFGDVFSYNDSAKIFTLEDDLPAKVA